MDLFNKFNKLTVIIGFLSALGIGCSDSGSPWKLEERDGFLYENTLHTQYIDAIQQDLRYLKSLPLQEAQSPTFQRVMEIDPGTVSGPVLDAWLRERVKVFLGGLDGSEMSLRVTGERPAVFQETRSSSDASTDTPSLALEDHWVTPHLMYVLSNYGAQVYDWGKRRGAFLSIQIGERQMEVRSPRAGLVTVNRIIFYNGLLSETAQRIYRLATYFHEARHSDGHGESLGFPHGKCKMADGTIRAACDACGNGPYAVQTEILDWLIDSCGIACSAQDLKVLKLERVMTKKRILDLRCMWDTHPEE